VKVSIAFFRKNGCSFMRAKYATAIKCYVAAPTRMSYRWETGILNDLWPRLPSSLASHKENYPDERPVSVMMGDLSRDDGLKLI